MNHWYFVNQIGMATLCADKADAEKCAAEADEAWPRHAPHVAMRLVDAEQMDGLLTALSACRDAMPNLPGIPIDEAIQHPESVPAYVMATVTQLMAAIETERTARQAAHIRIEELQAQLVRADAERCKAVAAERDACAAVCDKLPAPESCTGVERSLWDVATTECASSIRARGSQ